MILAFHLGEDDEGDDPLPPRGICDGVLVEDNLPAAMVRSVARRQMEDGSGEHGPSNGF